MQFFLSTEVWERVSEHGYRKTAVQALAPIGEQERDRQREEEARKSEVCRDQSLRRIFQVSCGTSELSQAWQVTFFFSELMFLIKPTPDAGVYVSVQGKMLGCSSLLNGGGFKSAKTRFSHLLYVPQMW